MQYKNILVYLDQGDSNAGRVKTAVDMAAAYDARLTGVAVNPLPTRNMIQKLGADKGETLVKQSRAETEEIFKEFETLVADRGLQHDTRLIEGRESEAPEKLAHLARYFDISLLRQANPDRSNAEPIEHLSAPAAGAYGGLSGVAGAPGNLARPQQRSRS